ncbi:MAG: hypothetical protein HY22_13280 [[Candidatus Thermochlorobacteriaceae] bacterium GBChlB]|jgi:tellurite resistance protein|nr:MAG: hypothetical protein HY22_13280 [[Candidatus Thermochlorobacteriaceae] bacterium GBChlB]
MSETINEALAGTEGDNTLSASDSFAAIALVAVAADGQVSPEENQQLTNTLTRMKLYEGWSKEQFSAMLKRINGVMRRLGVSGLIAEAARSISPDLKETVFAVASDLTLADGAVEEPEKRFLNHLQSELGIANETATKIVEVMVLKNKG